MCRARARAWRHASAPRCWHGCWPRSRTSGSATNRASRRSPSTGPRTGAISNAASRPHPCSSRRPNVPALLSFDYALLRVVPRVEREEFVNAGVVLFCREREFLEARVELDRARVLALLPDADLTLIDEHLR